MLLRFSLMFVLIVYSVTYGFAQLKDSASVIQSKSDTIPKHSPKKAAIMSACLPGLGQVYNKKYWKVPALYASFGLLGYAFYQNQTNYVMYRDAYKYRIDNDASTVDKYVGIYSSSSLFDAQQYYHRNRDLSLIGLGILYTLNIIDASVDGHLYNFDVSDDLSINIQPDLYYSALNINYKTALTININF